MTNRTLLQVTVGTATAGVLAAAVWAAPAASSNSFPATRPAAATKPAAVPLPPVSTKPLPMASAFTAVRYRSIFVKGEQALSGGGGVTGPAAPAGPVTPARPQATLVFHGVTLIGDRADAMIEDTVARKVFSVRVGDALAGGRVLGVTFDDIDYQSAGKVIHVGLGQNLDGADAAPGDTDAPSAGGGPVPGDSAGTLGNTVGMSTDDILARMKRRRQMEQGGK